MIGAGVRGDGSFEVLDRKADVSENSEAYERLFTRLWMHRKAARRERSAVRAAPAALVSMTVHKKGRPVGGLLLGSAVRQVTLRPRTDP